MKSRTYRIATGNQAVAEIAYQTNEICVIYPITPASEMSELVEAWSAENKENSYGGVPSVVEMQSESGVAGALHGALQTGSLATTFTASQGLLLMIPNMYKIAGELTPNVIHVATRSVATHALSVFGDHSDIMAARSTGYAFLGSASVQEAHDFALIAQAASLASRIPFVHFFDGFRTSHETNTIESIDKHTIKEMMDDPLITAHRLRGLSPNRPVVRGTTQGPDVFFQGREAVNSFYDACPDIVQRQMEVFAKLTGRHYRIFDYVGHPQADRIIIAMASGTETIEQTVHHLNARGEKTGLIKVRLFRPFSAKHLLAVVPSSCKAIAVLDRTKEPGATGEPLYLDVVNTMTSTAKAGTTLPRIVGGRYGISSKEFTPGMVKAVFDNLNLNVPKNNFTLGIHDDVTHLSLPYTNDLYVQEEQLQVLFYETKSPTSCDRFNSLLQLVENKGFVQGYTEIDYSKSNSRTVSNLRLGTRPIRAPYLIENAHVVACDSKEFLENDTAIERLGQGAVLVVATPHAPQKFWAGLSETTQKNIVKKQLRLLTIREDAMVAYKLKTSDKISALHACVCVMHEELGLPKELEILRESIEEVDTRVRSENEERTDTWDTEFSTSLLGRLLARKGNELPVSSIPVDGTYPTDTSGMKPRYHGKELPQWHADTCTQCGACSMACPQGALRMKVYDDHHLAQAPPGFQAVKALDEVWSLDLLNYTLQVNVDQCTGCHNCVDACTVKALSMADGPSVYQREQENWAHFDPIPEMDRSRIRTSDLGQQQLQEPLFKYSDGVEGCGQAPYLKLLSQLFGDRMLVANATGASSIFGGALPTTPWSKNGQGRGPAWSNSLFEDNAEFGLGYRLSLDQQEAMAKKLLMKLAPELNNDLVDALLHNAQRTEGEIEQQRRHVEKLKQHLKGVGTKEAQQLFDRADSLVKQSVWIVGGDGWAYDIGFGGLDHVAASGRNVNILVLDNEVYSNTGGQMSKATPFGATARFAHRGKDRQKKDLGHLLMGYDEVYVAQVAIGADPQHTLNAFLEAETYDGPSIVIAYCHSPAHGIDMKYPSQYHKAAVASGQWLLYRNDPSRNHKGNHPFQLDSPRPTLKIQTYFAMQRRFTMMAEGGEGNAFDVRALQERIYRRYDRLAALGQNSVVPTQLGQQWQEVF